MTWGDEVEFTLVHLDPEERHARVLLKGSQVIPALRELESDFPGSPEESAVWNFEGGEFHVEATPGRSQEWRIFLKTS